MNDAAINALLDQLRYEGLPYAHVVQWDGRTPHQWQWMHMREVGFTSFYLNGDPVGDILAGKLRELRNFYTCLFTRGGRDASRLS